MTKPPAPRRPDPEELGALVDRAKALALAGELDAARATWTEVERLLAPPAPVLALPVTRRR